MIARREGEAVRSKRVSSLIAVSKARIFASEGWQVTITDAAGKVFEPSAFDDLLVSKKPAQPTGRARDPTPPANS
jgi:hypothetical protein